MSEAGGQKIEIRGRESEVGSYIQSTIILFLRKVCKISSVIIALERKTRLEECLILRK